MSFFFHEPDERTVKTIRKILESLEDLGVPVIIGGHYCYMKLAEVGE